MTDYQKSSSVEEQQLLASTRELLEHQSEHLDMSTLMKLEKSRKQALQQSTNRVQLNNGGTLVLSTYLPGSLIALAMLILLTYFTLDRELPAVENSIGIYTDLDLLGAKEPLELYEDMAFYEWLELDE